MFITLSQWYYHSSMCGYQTKPVIVNLEEVSEVKEVYDPYHNMDGSLVVMKNGNSINVREDIVTISKRMQAATERYES